MVMVVCSGCHYWGPVWNLSSRPSRYPVHRTACLFRPIYTTSLLVLAPRVLWRWLPSHFASQVQRSAAPPLRCNNRSNTSTLASSPLTSQTFSDRQEPMLGLNIGRAVSPIVLVFHVVMESSVTLRDRDGFHLPHPSSSSSTPSSP